jgi:hypothetical protein
MQLFTYAAIVPNATDPLAHVLVLMACSATNSVPPHRRYNGLLWQTPRLH